MDPGLVSMMAAGNRALGGGHDSQFWHIDTPWHYHDLHQLLYSFQGAVDVEGETASYRIPHQFAAWIPAGAVHRTRIQNVASVSVFLRPELVPDAGDHPRVIRAPALLREMVRQAMQWPLGRADCEASRTYFRCIGMLCGEWIKASVQMALPSLQSPPLQTVALATKAEIATISFAELARATGFSERSLRRKFKTEAGIGWDEYRRRLRVFMAIELLETTTQSVGAIAAEVGYENPAAFARAFRDAMGIAPSEYRRGTDGGRLEWKAG